MNWRTRLALAPLWIPFLVIFAGIALILPLFFGHERRAIIAASGIGLATALAVTVLVRIVRLRQWAITGASEREDKMMVIRAMQTGEPPADPSFDSGLLTLVTKRRARNRLSPWFPTVMAVLYMPLAIMGRQAHSIAFACGWTALAVFAWTERVRDRDRLARLEENLRGRQAAGSA
jgi:hypothetical protein